MTIWNLDVDRVRIVGVGGHSRVSQELRFLITQAVQSALETTTLPNGRTVRATVEVRVPSLAGGAAIADAVALGVTRAMEGRTHG